MAKKVNT
ncbi:hypothetical protein VCCP104417_2035, partial [Vibrio cholerae CP1044(17)]